MSKRRREEKDRRRRSREKSREKERSVMEGVKPEDAIHVCKESLYCSVTERGRREEGDGVRAC